MCITDATKSIRIINANKKAYKENLAIISNKVRF